MYSIFIMQNTIDQHIKYLIYFYIHTKQSPYKVAIYKNYLQYRTITPAIQDKLQQIEKYGCIRNFQGNKAKEAAYRRFVAEIAEKCAPVIEELQDIDGIGLRTAVELCAKHKVRSISQLRTMPLPTYIANAISMHGKVIDRIPRATISTIAKQFTELLGKGSTHAVCGSYRRGKQQSGDIDLVICKTKAHPTLSSALSAIAPLLHKDLSSRSSSTKYSGYLQWRKRFYHIDVRFVPSASYITAVFYYTGSALFNLKIRAYAKKKGFKLNEYGLWRGTKAVATPTEEAIFKALDLAYIPPNKRELTQ